MSDILSIIRSFREEPCACGRIHETSVRDVQIGSELVRNVGDILKKNEFPEKLLLVADRNTLKAAEGILESLQDFQVSYHIYDNLRVATMDHATEIEALISGQEIAILSVGTGSVNDPCRLAAARGQKKLCIFATAPSMDGFASYSSPLVKNGFKKSFPAKSPEVIIGDTKILASAPADLKSAGFGDMVSKYIGLVDWQISTLLTGEYYCEKIAALTRSAIDELMEMADKVTENDEKTAGKIFEALLKTGIGMSFSQNSRPASGSEHIISHLIECVELRDGIVPNYHGDDIGVCTLEMLKFYHSLKEKKSISAQKEQVNWDEVYAYYGDMADEVRQINEPDTVTEDVDPQALQEKWGQVVSIIDGIPSYEACLVAMKKAGCKLTVADIGKSRTLFDDCVKYSPYMRKRLTLLRLRDMIE